VNDGADRNEPIDDDFPSRPRPAGAVAALLISIYSWLLIVGIHVYNALFAGIGFRGVKYYVTLGIAVVSALYVSFHGRALTRRWLPRKAGGIVLTARETLLVVAVVLFFSAYFTWIVWL